MAKKAAKRAGKPGRKPLPDDERRDAAVIPIRLRADEHDVIRRAVDALAVDDATLSGFVRDAALKEARRVLGE